MQSFTAGASFEWSPGLIGQPVWPQNELLVRRIVFLNGFLNGETAARVSAELMTLDALGTDPVDLYIDSADGTLDAALILMDTIDLMRAETRAQALGEVGGPAVGVLAVARRRASGPSARLHLSEPRTAAAGTTDNLRAQVEQHQRLTERFRDRLAAATGRTAAEVAHDLTVGRYLDAREALDYGLVDNIATRASRAANGD